MARPKPHRPQRRDRPHDLLFRYVFAQVRHARGVLRFLLGEEAAKRLDWTTLRHEPGSYVEERLRDSLSDLLFSVEFHGSRHRALAYCVWEHLRNPRRLMPLHLLNYGGRALRDYTRSRDAIPGYLPLLIPVLIYQGRRPWPGPFRLSELHQVPEHPHLPIFMDLRMVVHELRHDSIPPEELTSVARTALRLMRLAAASALVLASARRVARWLTEVHEDEEAQDDDFQALVEYVFRAGEDEGMIDAIMMHTGEPMRRAIVSIADKLEARGRAELLLHLLEQRFGELPDHVRARVHAGTGPALERWGQRMFEATSLDDVFTPP